MALAGCRSRGPLPTAGTEGAIMIRLSLGALAPGSTCPLPLVPAPRPPPRPRNPPRAAVRLHCRVRALARAHPRGRDVQRGAPAVELHGHHVDGVRVVARQGRRVRPSAALQVRELGGVRGVGGGGGGWQAGAGWRAKGDSLRLQAAAHQHQWSPHATPVARAGCSIGGVRRRHAHGLWPCTYGHMGRWSHWRVCSSCQRANPHPGRRPASQPAAIPREGGSLLPPAPGARWAGLGWAGLGGAGGTKRYLKPTLARHYKSATLAQAPGVVAHEADPFRDLSASSACWLLAVRVSGRRSPTRHFAGRLRMYRCTSPSTRTTPRCTAT